MIRITPTNTSDEREKVRREARSKATSKWFGLVLDHHEELETLFAKVKSASSVTARIAAQKELALLLPGHSIAEEAIIDPFMKIDTSGTEATHV